VGKLIKTKKRHQTKPL